MDALTMSSHNALTAMLTFYTTALKEQEHTVEQLQKGSEALQRQLGEVTKANLAYRDVVGELQHQLRQLTEVNLAYKAMIDEMKAVEWKP